MSTLCSCVPSITPFHRTVRALGIAGMIGGKDAGNSGKIAIYTRATRTHQLDSTDNIWTRGILGSGKDKTGSAAPIKVEGDLERKF